MFYSTSYRPSFYPDKRDMKRFPKALRTVIRAGILVSSLGAPLQAASVKDVTAPAPAPAGPDLQLQDFRIGELEANLQKMQSGPERDYFAGVLANRTGRIAESVRLLNSALPGLRVSNPGRAEVALETLGDDYTKSFNYAAAAGAYDDLLAHFAGRLDETQSRGIKNSSDLTHILQETPAQTITWAGPAKLNTKRNVLGSANVTLTVNGIHEQWLLDTGAGMSVVSKSFAQRLGLNLLKGATRTRAGVTGIDNELKLAVVHDLTIGGATLHNVVALVLDDENLNIQYSAHDKYQINGIIGYPVFQSLGAVSFLHDGGFAAGEAARTSTAGARMYMKELKPVVECAVGGKNLPFTFDTGASSSDLSVRYYKRFQSKTSGWKRSTDKVSGAGGVVSRTIYVQPKLILGIGDKSVTLNDVTISPSTTGAPNDELYGNLGQDVVAKFDSFTLDFVKMTFSLGEPLSGAH
jgi:predicted aspartyl protease